MTDPWPTSWDDEPWPLEDPSPGPALRPTSWSDSLAPEDVPHPADLADEAYAYAEEHGCSLERALAELQHLRGRHALAGAQLAARSPRTVAAVGAGVTYHYAVAPSGVVAAVRAQEEETQRRAYEAAAARAHAAMEDFATGIRTVAEAFANIDLADLLEQVQSMAEEAKQPAVRFCPRHGAMAKGGWCRRCGR